MARVLRADKLGTLVEKLKAAGYRVVALKREGELVLFREIASAGEIAGNVVNTDKSFKEYLFPCSEKILGYRMAKDKVELEEPGDAARKTVILGCRPCDAASLPIITEVFKWDYQDEFFLKRLEATTVVSAACATCDSYCFCTSVGLAPNTKQGSDVLLTKTADG
ncbi:MAG: heterodisulfide reductase subunit A, partial [Planctomycetes bacterium]|nr:heterodisulfide reductase subunit A [Planctomycetota bacterium]